MKKGKWVPLLAGVSALGVMLSGCGGETDASDEGGEDSVVRIATVDSLSGDLASIGTSYTAGVELAVSDINSDGGFEVDGEKYTLELIDKDTQSEGPGTLAAMNEALIDEEAFAVFGPMSTALALQAAEVSVASGVLHFSGAGGLAEQGYLDDPSRPLLFGTYQSQVATAETLGLGLVEDGYETVALVNTDDETTESNFSALEAGLESAGIEIVADVRYPQDTSDLTSFVTRAAQQDPDVIFHATAPNRTLEVLNLAEELGASDALAAWVVSPQALEDASFDLPAYTANSGPSMDAPDSEQIAAFAERMSELKGDLGETKDYAFWTYDFVYMLVAAMQEASTIDDPDAIADVLLGMSYEGVVGDICYGDENGVREPVYSSYLSSSIEGEITVTERPRECGEAKTLEVGYFGP